MRKFLFILFLLSLQVLAQKQNGFNLVLGAGPSYFFNDKSLHRHVDNTFFFGGNYALHNKGGSLVFCPGARVQINDYHARLKNKNLVHIDQHALSLHCDVLLKISRVGFIKVGLFYCRIVSSSVMLSWKDNTSTNYIGSSELSKGYSFTSNQVGFNVGYSIPFRLFRRDHKFNITYQYIASRLVNSDYILSKALVGEDLTVLSMKARPSMFTFGFDFSLKRLQKKKKEEEE